MTGTDERRSAYRFGLDAERRAMLALLTKGYRTIASRYRVPGGEIDLVVRRGRTIVAVEVKARPTLDEAAIAITPRQIARIAAAMARFRAEYALDDRFTLRCDAVLVAPGRWPRHLVDVGRLDL
jgi:putative endonuclease